MKTVTRIIALIAAIVIVGMVITTFVMGIMGSPYTLGMFGLTFFIVIQIFLILLLMKLIDRHNSKINDQKSPNQEEL